MIPNVIKFVKYSSIKNHRMNVDYVITVVISVAGQKILTALSVYQSLGE